MREIGKILTVPKDMDALMAFKFKQADESASRRK